MAIFARSRPDWVLYTAAAFEECPNAASIDAIVFRVETGLRPVGGELPLSSARRNGETAFPGPKSAIFVFELDAMFLAIAHFRESIRDESLEVYGGNNAAAAALINGDSSSATTFPIIQTVWFISATHNISIWFAREVHGRNIEDARREEGHFPPRSHARCISRI